VLDHKTLDSKQSTLAGASFIDGMSIQVPIVLDDDHNEWKEAEIARRFLCGESFGCIGFSFDPKRLPHLSALSLTNKHSKVCRDVPYVAG